MSTDDCTVISYEGPVVAYPIKCQICLSDINSEPELVYTDCCGHVICLACAGDAIQIDRVEQPAFFWCKNNPPTHYGLPKDEIWKGCRELELRILKSVIEKQ